MVNVLLYGNLASIAGGTSTSVDAGSVAETLNALSTRYGADFHEKLYDRNGAPRRFINIYVNGRDYRFLQKLETILSQGDEVSLIPAVSGG